MLIKEQPILTAEGALFPFSEALAQTFTPTSRFGDPIVNWKSRGSGDHKKILVPRAVCPIGLKDKRSIGLDVEFESSFKPRNPEQAKFIEDLYAFLHTKESGIGEAPTGFGKTACAMQLIAMLGKKVAVVVTKEDVKDQWIAAAKQFLGLTDKDIGIVQGTRCDVVGKKIVICMIQSVSREGKYPEGTFKDIGFVIWDEVHRVGADQFKQSVWMFPALLRLGLSATPTRKDGKEIVFKQHIGPVRAHTNMMKLVPRVFIQRSNWSVPVNQHTGKPIPHSAGKTMHLNKIMARDFQRNQMIGRFIHRAWLKGRSIIVFSDLIEHLENMQVAAKSFGVKHRDMAFYIGGLKKDEREAAKIKPVIFSTYAFVSEATDIPWLDTAVLATPRSDVIQIVGRILREYEDKKDPVVFDIRDKGSKVFDGYLSKRIRWYKKIGAEVKQV